MVDIDLDELSAQVGGRFRLCTMVIKRARSLLLAQGGGFLDANTQLNSQIIRQAFSEIQEGRLELREPEEE